MRKSESMTNSYLYKSLPIEFKYPNEFLDFLNENVDLYPWILARPESKVGELLLDIALKRNLVPFASLENGDGDVACFRVYGNDQFVEMLVMDGSQRSYSFNSFSDWLTSAKKDHNKFGMGSA